MSTDEALQKRIDAEWKMVGCAITAPADIRNEYGWLPVSAFWSQEVGQFWQRYLTGADPYDIAYELGTEFHQRALRALEDVPSWTYAPTYASAVANAAYLAEVKETATKLLLACNVGNAQAAREHTQHLAELTPKSFLKLRDAADANAAFLEALTWENRNLPTYISALDRAIGGLERQTLTLIAGRPSQGKTTLGWQIARNLAVAQRKVFFVSLEMSEISLWARAACPLVGLTWLDVRQQKFTDEQRRALEQAASDLANQLAPYLALRDLATSSSQVWELALPYQPDLIVIDHLRLLSDAGDNEVQRLGEITWQLKQMAKALNCALLLLVQLSRAQAIRGGPPVLTDLRDSGQIEENADVVLMIHGEDPPTDGRPRATMLSDLWVRKHRDGQRDVKIELTLHAAAQWFVGRQEPAPSFAAK